MSVPLSACSLHRLTEDALPLILAWRNSDRVRPWMMQDVTIKFEDHLAWFKRIAPDPDFAYWLFKVEGKPVGLVYFSALQRPSLEAEWGFYVGESSPPAGAGTAMGILALDWYFTKTPGLLLRGEVLEFNSKSVAYHERLLFQENPKLQRTIVRGEKPCVIRVFELSKEDWLQKSEPLRSAFQARGR